MVLVHNLADGRSLLLITIDHAIGDGIGLLSLCLSLFDDDDTKEDEEKESAPRLSSSSSTQTKQQLSWSHTAVAFLAGVYDGIVNTLLPELTADPLNHFMIPMDRLWDDYPGKTYAQTRPIPVADFKVLKSKIAGATLNDVIVSVIGRALQQYLTAANNDNPSGQQNQQQKQQLRAKFAVNMRRGSERTGVDVGNCAVIASFPFPIDMRDPIEAVWSCKTRGDELKSSPAFALRHRLTDLLLDTVPAHVLAPKLIRNVNLNTCLLSNNKGPTNKASFAGYAVDDLHFVAQGSVGLYVGILTFAGKLHVTLTKDDRTTADIEELRELIEQCYEELEDALKDVDPEHPLEFDFVKPVSARILEFLVYSCVVVAPVFLATQYTKF